MAMDLRLRSPYLVIVLAAVFASAAVPHVSAQVFYSFTIIIIIVFFYFSMFLFL